jgi:multimeric flavodoxin WrbA
MNPPAGLKVLGLSASPREGGNTDLLLAEALAGAAAAGASVERIDLRGLNIAPCAECNACSRTGVCRVEDDFHKVLARMLEADRLVFATPIFFMTVSAQGKLFIDRCQCLWARKQVLRVPLFPDGPRDRRALVIAVGGSKSRKMFECVRLTMQYFLDAAGLAAFGHLFVNQVDGRGDVQRAPAILAEARRLGGLLAEAEAPPQEPVTVELSGTCG